MAAPLALLSLAMVYHSVYNALIQSRFKYLGAAMPALNVRTFSYRHFFGVFSITSICGSILMIYCGSREKNKTGLLAAISRKNRWNRTFHPNFGGFLRPREDSNLRPTA